MRILTILFLACAVKAATLRDIVGNPFAKPIVLNGGAPWAAIEIARAAYDERYDEFQELYRKTRGTFARMNRKERAEARR